MNLLYFTGNQSYAEYFNFQESWILQSSAGMQNILCQKVGQKFPIKLNMYMFYSATGRSYGFKLNLNWLKLILIINFPIYIKSLQIKVWHIFSFGKPKKSSSISGPATKAPPPILEVILFLWSFLKKVTFREEWILFTSPHSIE